MSAQEVEIRYRRLPEREDVFRQRLIEDAGEYVVTYLPAAGIEKPLVVRGTTILEPRSPIVWFTYPGRWYDIGRFHLADGTFTGYYANILTPVAMNGRTWSTTDLCLDLWSASDGDVQLLDEQEFADAVEAGWIDTATATAARETAETLALLGRQGGWPPEHVREWTLQRVSEVVAAPSGGAEPRSNPREKP